MYIYISSLNNVKYENILLLIIDVAFCMGIVGLAHACHNVCKEELRARYTNVVQMYFRNTFLKCPKGEWRF